MMKLSLSVTRIPALHRDVPEGHKLPLDFPGENCLCDALFRFAFRSPKYSDPHQLPHQVQPGQPQPHL